MSYVRLLSDLPKLRILILAQVPADLSDWLDYIAIGILVSFTWQADPLVFAWLGAATGLPYLIVGPFAGVLADRWSVRWVLIVSNVLRGVATIAIFFTPDISWLLLVLAVRSCVDSLYTPAKQIAMIMIVPEENRMRANGLSHAINQVSKVLGPSCGAALLLLMDERSVFLVNGCVSLVAAGILLGFTIPANGVDPKSGDERRTLVGLLLGGFAEILSKSMLLISLLMMAGAYFSIFLFDRFTPILARNLGFAQDVYSLAVMAVGVGGVLGALGAGTVSREDRGFDLIVLGALGVAVLLFVIGGRPIHGVKLSPIAFMVVFFGLGVLTPLVVVPFNTILQREADASRVGSVFAVNEALNVGAMLTAPFVGALLAQTYGTEASFLAGAAGMSAVAMLALVVRLARSSPSQKPPNS